MKTLLHAHDNELPGNCQNTVLMSNSIGRRQPGGHLAVHRAGEAALLRRAWKHWPLHSSHPNSNLTSGPLHPQEFEIKVDAWEC